MGANMGVIRIPSSGIVPQVLMDNLENYKEWSIRLRTYVMAQDAWDVVEPAPTFVDVWDAEWEMAWNRKNATALHAIHISCSSRAFAAIQDIPEAKCAWDKLAESLVRAGREPLIQAAIQEYATSADWVRQLEPLYNAVWDGNYNATEEIIRTNPGVARARITFSRRTALHVAAMAGHMSIVELLVQNMSMQDLEITGDDGFTALAVAIISNATKSIAECMVRKNTCILTIKVCNMLPVAMAFRYGHIKLGRYLYSMMPEYRGEYPVRNLQESASVMCNAIYMQCFDVALDLLSKCKQLAITVESSPDGSSRPPVHALANLHSGFLSGRQLRFWQQWLYDRNDSSLKVRSKLIQGLALYDRNFLGIKDLYNMKLGRYQTSKLLSQMCKMTKTLDGHKMRELHVIEALFLAVERGNVEFVRSMLHANPELGVMQGESCRNIFMHAIEFRQPKIFSLIYDFNLKLPATSAVAYQKTNMLHIAATLAPNPQLNRIPGAALQMQSELRWFQEVRSVVPLWALSQKNVVNNMTPDELFTEAHRQLVIEAEKWMKETATSCTVVGALIITIMFAVAFTVPGGNHQDSGFPIFLNKNTFMIFIISDALSLFSSTASVLMFLGILTSRYAEQDFLESLPRKLMLGLFALFFSIVSMMVAFSATLLLVLRVRYSWTFIPLICLASIPATLFVFMQFRLLVDIFLYTYGGGIFDKKAKILK